MMLFKKTESINMFLLFCIPTRLIISLVPLFFNKKFLFYYGFLLGTIGFSFLYLYFMNQRLKAPEAGGVTWWANFRLIHGLLYICGSIYSLQGKKIASIPLLIDTFFGFTLFINKHFYKFMN